MFTMQFEEPYLSEAQQIMGRFCTEVGGDDPKTPKTYDVLKSFLNAAKKASKEQMQLQSVKFGAENITETPMPLYYNENQMGTFVSALSPENNALMLSTREGAVFCCAVVQVGDKEYISLMNPQTAMEIRDAMQEMVDHVKENDKTKQLEQLTIWDKICDFFAQLFRDRPGEAVSRAEAYRNFYDGMQKHMDLLGRVGQTRTAQNYKYNREYQAADPNAAQNEEIQKESTAIQPNNQAVQKKLNAIQQPEVKNADGEVKGKEEEPVKKEEPIKKEEQPVKKEEQPVKKEPVKKEERPVKEEEQPVKEFKEVDMNSLPRTAQEFRAIYPFEQEGFGSRLRDADLQELLNEEHAKIDAKKREALLKQKELEERIRQYEKAQQTRNAALKNRADKIAAIKANIKKEEEFINEWEPKYLKRQETVDELNKQLRDLNEYNMQAAGKNNRNRLVNQQTELEGKIQKITDWMARVDKDKTFWERKEAAEKKVETTQEAIEKAKKKLEPVANELRYAELEMQYWAGIGQRNGAWMKPEEYLKNQYNQDKAQRDRKFAEEQKGRDEKITALENELAEYEKVAKNFSKQLGWFSKTDEEKEKRAVYNNYVKDTKEKLRVLKEENQQANKRHNEEDKAKQKELLSPSKELLEKTTEKISDAKKKWDAAFSKYKNIGTKFDLVKGEVVEKEEAHRNAVEDYKNNYQGKTVKFDGAHYMRVEGEKARLTRELKEKKNEIAQFDAKAATYEQDAGAILTKVAPLGDVNADLEIKLKAAKFRLERFKGELAEVNVDVAPLGMEDPRKESKQNEQNKQIERNEPQKQSGGLGMGGM